MVTLSLIKQVITEQGLRVDRVETGLESEVLGLSEAMKFFNLESGIILTFNQNDSLVRNGKMISVIPAFSYLTNV